MWMGQEQRLPPQISRLDLSQACHTPAGKTAATSGCEEALVSGLRTEPPWDDSKSVTVNLSILLTASETILDLICKERTWLHLFCAIEEYPALLGRGRQRAQQIDL